MKNDYDGVQIANPMLKAFSSFIGEWKTVGKHSMLPGVTLRGRASFEWIEGGAFMVMRSTNDDPKIPAGISIFGSDNTRSEFFMLYFDERQVSRKCDVSVDGNVWKWWRNGPEFSQRYSFRLSDDGNTIIGTGEMSKDDGKTWEEDLSLMYERI